MNTQFKDVVPISGNTSANENINNLARINTNNFFTLTIIVTIVGFLLILIYSYLHFEYNFLKTQMKEKTRNILFYSICSLILLIICSVFFLFLLVGTIYNQELKAKAYLEKKFHKYLPKKKQKELIFVLRFIKNEKLDTFPLNFEDYQNTLFELIMTNPTIFLINQAIENINNLDFIEEKFSNLSETSKKHNLLDKEKLDIIDSVTDIIKKEKKQYFLQKTLETTQSKSYSKEVTSHVDQIFKLFFPNIKSNNSTDIKMSKINNKIKQLININQIMNKSNDINNLKLNYDNMIKDISDSNIKDHFLKNNNIQEFLNTMFYLNKALLEEFGVKFSDLKTLNQALSDRKNLNLSKKQTVTDFYNEFNSNSIDIVNKTNEIKSKLQNLLSNNVLFSDFVVTKLNKINQEKQFLNNLTKNINNIASENPITTYLNRLINFQSIAKRNFANSSIDNVLGNLRNYNNDIILSLLQIFNQKDIKTLDVYLSNKVQLLNSEKFGSTLLNNMESVFVEEVLQILLSISLSNKSIIDTLNFIFMDYSSSLNILTTINNFFQKNSYSDNTQNFISTFNLLKNNNILSDTSITQINNLNIELSQNSNINQILSLGQFHNLANKITNLSSSSTPSLILLIQQINDVTNISLEQFNLFLNNLSQQFSQDLLRNFINLISDNSNTINQFQIIQNLIQNNSQTMSNIFKASPSLNLTEVQNYISDIQKILTEFYNQVNTPAAPGGAGFVDGGVGFAGPGGVDGVYAPPTQTIDPNILLNQINNLITQIKNEGYTAGSVLDFIQSTRLLWYQNPQVKFLLNIMQKQNITESTFLMTFLVGDINNIISKIQSLNSLINQDFNIDFTQDLQNQINLQKSLQSQINAMSLSLTDQQSVLEKLQPFADSQGLINNLSNKITINNNNNTHLTILNNVLGLLNPIINNMGSVQIVLEDYMYQTQNSIDFYNNFSQDYITFFQDYYSLFNASVSNLNIDILNYGEINVILNLLVNDSNFKLNNLNNEIINLQNTVINSYNTLKNSNFMTAINIDNILIMSSIINGLPNGLLNKIQGDKDFFNQFISIIQSQFPNIDQLSNIQQYQNNINFNSFIDYYTLFTTQQIQYIISSYQLNTNQDLISFLQRITHPEFFRFFTSNNLI